jgi:hypothetical protein
MTTHIYWNTKRKNICKKLGNDISLYFHRSV